LNQFLAFNFRVTRAYLMFDPMQELVVKIFAKRASCVYDGSLITKYEYSKAVAKAEAVEMTFRVRLFTSCSPGQRRV